MNNMDNTKNNDNEDYNKNKAIIKNDNNNKDHTGNINSK